MAEEQEAAAATETTTTEGGLLEEILGATQMKPTDDGYDVARKGVHAFIAELLAPTHQGAKIDKSIVDGMIVEIDKKLSKQLDAIMHQSAFQKLESAWRGLKFVVDRTNFRENIKIELLNVSKDDLIADFEDAPEVTKSGLYKTAYTAEYGTFGGKPFGAIFSNYEFGPGAQDMELPASSIGAACFAKAAACIKACS